MKACKIILISLLVIKTIVAIVKALASDGEEQLENVIKVLVAAPITWLLYWGAGLLDF